MKYYKYGLISLIFLFPALLFSQVGINTKNPKSTLDINGSMQIRESIKIPTSNVKIDSDDENESGYYLTSQGEDLPPKWSKIPRVYWSIGQTIAVHSNTGEGIAWGPYRYRYNDFIVDNENKQSEIPDPLLEDSPLSSPWKRIPNLGGNIFVETKNSKIAYDFQTIVQISETKPYVALTVAIGIFIDDKLKSVREISMYADGGGFVPIEINDIIEDLQPKIINPNRPVIPGEGTNINPYKIEVAARIRYYSVQSENYNYILVGRSIESTTNTSDFMNRSSLSVTLFEENKK